MKVLNKACLLLEEAHDPIKIKFMAPEDAEKHKLLMERKAEQRAKAQQQRADAEAIRKRVEYDQAEKAQEEVKTSVGNKLSFGA